MAEGVGQGAREEVQRGWEASVEAMARGSVGKTATCGMTFYMKLMCLFQQPPRGCSALSKKQRKVVAMAMASPAPPHPQLSFPAFPAAHSYPCLCR